MEPTPEPRADAASLSLVERMRSDLARARRDHDGPAVSALRTSLSAMANAEAPPLPTPEAGRPPQAPEARPDVDRLVLSGSDLEAILAAEVADREDTIAIYERHGRVDEADDLRAQVAVLRSYQR